MSILDSSKAYCYYFEEITKIPHGSNDEQALSNWIIEFAKARGLAYYQDELFNVIIYKAASKGYENHAPLMIQAHIDMVCEKNQDVCFDFSKDALRLKIEDGFLKAEGTTLGADDGAGVAYMLAILDDDTLSHPALECVFTTQEEIGLFGAAALDKSKLQAHRLINLDGGGEVQTLISSAGGISCLLKGNPVMKKASGNAYQIMVSGCLGGHSGGEIDKERVNANKLLARILYQLQKQTPVQLMKFDGGLKENAIPREAICTFTSEMDFDAISKVMEPFIKALQVENEAADKQLSITYQSVTMPNQTYSKEMSDKLIKLMFILPNGMIHRNLEIDGLVDASLNLGVVSIDENVCELNISIRSATASMLDFLSDQMVIMGSMYDIEVSFSACYPGWAFEKTSMLRETLKTVFYDLYGKDLILQAVHGGCECGIFKAMHENMDIVTIGPITNDIHTPQEAMDLASFDRTYQLLTTYIGEL